MKQTKQAKEKTNFLFQAGILSVAGILTRIIGLLYRSPLHGIIGDLGLGYYQAAYAYYTIILLISSYSIPSAISKVISQKIALGKYKEAHKILKCALAYVLLVGAVASIFLFFCADLFVEPQAVSVLRTFAPTIFVYGILGVLRGYFQAYGSMIQTSVSQIIEQIINAIVSVGAAYVLIKISLGTLAMPIGNKLLEKRAINGAMGSALGTGSGVLIALIFILIMYLLQYKNMKKKIIKDKHDQIMNTKQIWIMITFTVTPFVINTAIYNLSTTVNTKLYTDIYPRLEQLSSMKITANWGIFSGEALTIANIPIAFASAMASAIIPSIATIIALKKYEQAREKIALAIKTVFMITIPCAVGLFVLARPITNLLFSNTQAALDQASVFLMVLSISVVFFALSTLGGSILQGLGKTKTPIVHALIALILQTVIGYCLLMFTSLGLYSIAIANLIYSATMCLLNQYVVHKAINYHQELKKSIFIPMMASICMGIFAWSSYHFIYHFCASMKIAVVFAICIGALSYLIALFILGGISKEEVQRLPFGDKLLFWFHR